MPDVTFSITVGNPWITLDENSETLPSATGEVVDILVKRTIPANSWNTICLPFAMSEEQVKEVFGEDVELAEFIEYEVTEENGEITKINVMFDSALLGEDGFMANYPYIIKTRKDISEFMVSSIIEPDEENAYAEYNNGRGGSRKEVYGTFYGTLRAGKRLEANQLFLNQGNLWYSVGNNTIKAFRGYFDFVDVLASQEQASNIRIRINGENTTGIELTNDDIINGIIYDIQGRQVRSANKGVYINNGKKIIIKGNHDYYFSTLTKVNKFLKDNNFDTITVLNNDSYLVEGYNICGFRGWGNTDDDTVDDFKVYKRELVRLELSLNSIKEENKDKPIIVMTHFPPFRYEIKEIFKKYNVKLCIYGHLHGDGHYMIKEGNIDGTEYKMVSGDYTKFELIKLI
jgi:predicted phosphohydrolase